MLEALGDLLPRDPVIDELVLVRHFHAARVFGTQLVGPLLRGDYRGSFSIAASLGELAVDEDDGGGQGEPGHRTREHQPKAGTAALLFL